MWLNLLILTLFLPLYFIRGLLWLTRLQQKEYRWDRYLNFLTNKTARPDLLKIFPAKKDFTRTGLTRPQITARIIVVTLLLDLSVLLILILFWNRVWWLWLFACGSIILLLPLLVLIVSLPTALIFKQQVKYFMVAAQQKIEQSKPHIIGITGSYGKTSTKILLAHVLRKKTPVFATQRSFNTRLSLSKDIAQRYQGEKIMVLEYAAYKKGEIKWLAKKIRPDWAVITGLAAQHLAIFKSINNIIQAKAELITALPADGLVFINAQDKGTKKITHYAQQKIAGNTKQIISYTGPKAKHKFSSVHLNNKAQLCFNYQNTKITTQLVGRRYLSAVRAAITIARQMELTTQQIGTALETFTPPPWFVTLKQQSSKFWLLDDGRTTNPAAFTDVIDLSQQIAVIKNIQQRYLITSGIIDLGPKSTTIHQQLAKKAQPIFDKVIYTGPAGKEQFSAVFNHNLIDQKEKIKKLLTNLSEHDLVVTEGWIPIWLQNFLKTS